MLTRLQQEIKERGFKLSLAPVETKSGTYYRATVTMRDRPTRMAYPMLKFGNLFRSKEEAATQVFDVLQNWGAMV
jgi:hypothetical protein